MSIIGVMVVLIVIGLLLWLVNSYIPMAEPIKKILNIAVIVLTVLWLLSLFINLGSFGTTHRIGSVILTKCLSVFV